MFLSRRQRARIAVYLARTQLLIFWIKLMGAAVVVSFLLVIASFFLITGLISVLSIILISGVTVTNLTILGTRWAVLQQGWLPVSGRELTCLGIEINEQPIEIQQALVKRSRELGWITWKEVWVILGGRPTVGDFRWGGGLRWDDTMDHLAHHRDFLSHTPMAVQRSDRGDALVGEGFALPQRARQRP
jgi:hypothetical protein